MHLCRFVLFFVAASASFAGFYAKWSFIDPDRFLNEPGMGQITFDKMMDGTASRPFVYRRLIPDIANTLNDRAPRLRRWLAQPLPQSGISRLMVLVNCPMTRDPRYAFRYGVVYLLTFLFVLAGLYAVSAVCRIAGASISSSLLVPVVVMLIFPYVTTHGGYFYDYPELFFMAAALAVCWRYGPAWTLPIVMLAAWNKESFPVFLPALYPFLSIRFTRLKAVLWNIGLIAATVPVCLWTHLRYHANSGGTVAVEWRHQLHWLATPRLWLIDREVTYAMLTPQAMTVLPMAVLALTVWIGWKYLPPVCRQHMLIAAAINLPLYLFLCNPGEMRNLSLLWMSFVFLAVFLLQSWERAPSAAA